MASAAGGRALRARRRYGRGGVLAACGMLGYPAINSSGCLLRNRPWAVSSRREESCGGDQPQACRVMPAQFHGNDDRETVAAPVGQHPMREHGNPPGGPGHIDTRSAAVLWRLLRAGRSRPGRSGHARVAVAAEVRPGEDALDHDVDKDPLVVLAQEPVPERGDDTGEHAAWGCGRRGVSSSSWPLKVSLTDSMIWLSGLKNCVTGPFGGLATLVFWLITSAGPRLGLLALLRLIAVLQGRGNE